MILKFFSQKNNTEKINFFFINLFIISNLIFWDFKIIGSNIKNFYLIFFLSFFFINKKIDIKKFIFLVTFLGFIILHSALESLDINRMIKISILFYLIIFFVIFNFDNILSKLDNCIINSYFFLVFYFSSFIPIKLLKFDNKENFFDYLIYKFSVYCNGININSLNLIFSENSHLGMILPALHSYYIFKSKNNLIFFIFLNFLTFLIIILFNSLTMFVSYIIFFSIYLFSLILKKVKLKKKIIISFCMLFFLILFFLLNFQGCKIKFFDISYSYLYKSENKENISVLTTKETLDKENITNILLEKFFKNVKQNNQLISFNQDNALKFKDNLEMHHPNVSSLTYVKHARLTLLSLKDKPFGWGLNNYGSAFIKYSEEVEANIADHFRNRHMLANYNDGSSNMFKLLVEFGIFNILLIFIFLKFVRSDIDIYLKIFLIGLLFTTFVRGAGYFNSSFLFCIVLITMMTYKKFRLLGDKKN